MSKKAGDKAPAAEIKRVGIVGLGLMGSALAERMLRAGVAVCGTDPAPERGEALRTIGGRPMPGAADVAGGCDALVLCLPTSDVVEQVISSVRPLRNGLLVIDTTTGEPDQTAALGSRLAGEGVRYLDATIAGSSAQALAGEVVVMAGGESADYIAASSLFRHFARRSFHLGPWGSGARMKLVVNLVIGLNRAALAEALAFAAKCGIDQKEALRVLQAGAAYSRVMDIKGRKMIERDFALEAKLSQHLKDVRLIEDAGEKCGARLPLTAVHRQLLEELEAAGYGEKDNSTIIRAFDAAGGAGTAGGGTAGTAGGTPRDETPSDSGKAGS